MVPRSKRGHAREVDSRIYRPIAALLVGNPIKVRPNVAVRGTWQSYPHQTLMAPFSRR
ncbi:hypothetical protein SBA3_3690008 [Candidatus Sulfopaludibacter sp. SbA3]|nr:hypothetical protein SBA3_3690008 [Candidatus Sulfopaludibacter sp. SbA3]